jgi:hypothetical protein
LLSTWGDVVTEPDVGDAVSQLGVVIACFTLPVVALNVYLNDDGEKAPP